MKLTIHFDGGCRGNPGQMYGSYQIQIQGSEVRRVIRKELGHGTNNEAEFKTLIHAITSANECFGSPKDHEVEIFTDSMIVRNRIQGITRNTEKSLRKLERKWGEKSVRAALRMESLTNECLLGLSKFSGFKIHWQGRENNVSNFGH